MKLTDESMRKLGAGNIVENRVLQDEESGEPLHILQRRNNVRRIYYAAIVFLCWLSQQLSSVVNFIFFI